MEDFCPHHVEIGLSKGEEMLMAYFTVPAAVPISITPTIDLQFIRTERDWTRIQIKQMEEQMEQRIANLSNYVYQQLKKISNAIPTHCYTYGDSCSIS